MADKKLIVVFGATGAQGGSVVRFLLQDGTFKVRGVTRDVNSDKAKALAAKGVEVVAADVSKRETLAAAFAGKPYGTFILTNFWDPSSMGKEKEQGIALVDAAHAAGVTHLQYHALPDVETQSGGKYHVPHFTDKGKVETYARTKGFKYTTFPGASFYYQNFKAFFPPKKDEATGEFVYTMPASSSITAFDVDDTGGAVLAAFKNPERWNGEYIPLSGDHLSPEEFIRQIGAATGTKTKLNAVPREVFAKFGFPGAGELAAMFGWFDEHTYHGKLAKRENSIRAYPQMKTFVEWIKASGYKP